MAWVAALVAAAYGGYQQHTQNRKAKQANARNASLFADSGPDYIGNAMAGYSGGNKYQQDLTGIAQGTYMDPNVIANPLAVLNRGADTNMQRVTASLGRSNMSGGLANAYALANRTGNQMNKASLLQNYGMWREKQRRADLDWLNGMRNTDLNRRAGLNREIADRYQEKGNVFGDMVGSFLGSYAGSSNQGNFFSNNLDSFSDGSGDEEKGSNIQTGGGFGRQSGNPYQNSQGKPWWSAPTYGGGQ